MTKSNFMQQIKFTKAELEQELIKRRSQEEDYRLKLLHEAPTWEIELWLRETQGDPNDKDKS